LNEGPKHAVRGGTDVREIYQVVRARWPVVLAVTVLAALLAALISMMTPRAYTTSTQGFVSVSDPQARSQNVLASGSQYILARMTSYAALASSTEVLTPVVETLGLDRSAAELSAQMSSRTVVNTTFIEVTVEDADPALAARIADATMQQLATTIQDLENGTVHVEVPQPAPVPDTPKDRHTIRNAALGGSAGIVLGIGIAVLVSRILDRRRDRALAR